MRSLLAIVAAGLWLGCGRSGLLDDGISRSASADGDSLPSADSAAGTSDAAGGPGFDAGTEGLDGDTVARGPDANAPSGLCNVFTCAEGCCLDDGGCLRSTAGPTSIPCGSYGEACVVCGAGFACNFGVCMQEAETICGPANCAGCCGAAPGPHNSSQCFEGSQDQACGMGGAVCQANCAPTKNGGHCVVDSTGGGHCEGAGQCNASNCAGCCSGDLCVEGSQDIGCGSGGVACQNCAGDGGVCTGLGLLDGGTEIVCGYDCDPPTSSSCTTYCSSVSDCFTAEQFFNGDAGR